MGATSNKLALRPPRVTIHDVFHASLLKKYVPIPNHVLYFDVIQMKDIEEFHTKPLMIVDTKQQHL
jgi:hypothetical protein